MPDLKLMAFRSELQPVWDDVVHTSKNGNFLHLRDYMDYHAHRFNEQSVIVYKSGKPVAVFPCNRVNNRIISHGGLTYAGLIYGTKLRATDILAIFEQLAEHYRGLGCCSLTYKAIPHIFHRYPAEEDLYALYRLGAHLVRRDLSTTVQMEGNIRWSNSRKGPLIKAEKLGTVIREGDFLERFHALLANTLIRRGLQPVHSFEELQLLQSRFPKQIRLFGAFRDGSSELQAGALIFDFGQVAHSQYLASSDQGKKGGALDLLLAHTLNKVFAQHQHFSFGISTEQNGHYLNEGLIFQKEGFGGRAVVHDFYELEF